MSQNMHNFVDEPLQGALNRRVPWHKRRMTLFHHRPIRRPKSLEEAREQMTATVEGCNHGIT